MISLEYLAGFIDGEGSLSLARRPRRQRSHEYCIRISIANTNKQILEDIHRDFGGVLAGSGVRNPRWKPGYALIWTNAAAAKLLVRVVSHLKVKSEQAAALIEFVAYLGKCRRARDRYGHLLPLSKPELKTREAFYRRLGTLNAKGPRRGASRPSRGPILGKQRRRGLSIEYLAGFIDAEGALFISRPFSKKYHSNWYIARISICNTNRRIIEEVQRDFGGTRVDIPSRLPKWRCAYTLVWTHAAAERLLRVVAPHLRVKARQASILMAFMRHKRNTVQGRKGKYFLRHPGGVLRLREAYYQQLKKLNARGPRPVPGGTIAKDSSGRTAVRARRPRIVR